MEHAYKSERIKSAALRHFLVRAIELSAERIVVKSGGRGAPSMRSSPKQLTSWAAPFSRLSVDVGPIRQFAVDG